MAVKQKSLASGARAAKKLLTKIERCNQRSVQKTGEPDLIGIAALIENSIDSAHRQGVILGLAEFICIALDGATTAASAWKPLRNLLKAKKVARKRQRPAKRSS